MGLRLLILAASLFRSMGSSTRGLSSRGVWACLPRGMWKLPAPGFEPKSHWEVGFLTTGPPGKTANYFLFFYEVAVITLLSLP